MLKIIFFYYFHFYSLSIPSGTFYRKSTQNDLGDTNSLSTSATYTLCIHDAQTVCPLKTRFCLSWYIVLISKIKLERTRVFPDRSIKSTPAKYCFKETKSADEKEERIPGRRDSEDKDDDAEKCSKESVRFSDIFCSRGFNFETFHAPAIEETGYPWDEKHHEDVWTTHRREEKSSRRFMEKISLDDRHDSEGICDFCEIKIFYFSDSERISESERTRNPDFIVALFCLSTKLWSHPVRIMSERFKEYFPSKILSMKGCNLDSIMCYHGGNISRWFVARKEEIEVEMKIRRSIDRIDLLIPGERCVVRLRDLGLIDHDRRMLHDARLVGECYHRK